MLDHLTPRAGWRFDGTTLRRVGAVLWDRIFASAPEVLDRLRRVEARARQERRGVRYVITPIASTDAGVVALESLPLELAAEARSATSPREFFFKRDSHPAVRCALESTSHEINLSGPVRVLVAMAHADGEPAPSPDALREHAEAITAAATRNSAWTVVRLPDATPAALEEAIVHGGYDVVHIACHGTTSRDDAGSLALCDGTVKGVDLARWLEASYRRLDALEAAVALLSDENASALARVLKARGDLSQQRNDWASALRWYGDARPIYKAVQDALGSSNVHAELAKVHRAMGRDSDACAFAELARSIGTACQNRDALSVATSILDAPSPVGSKARPRIVFAVVTTTVAIVWLVANWLSR